MFVPLYYFPILELLIVFTSSCFLSVQCSLSSDLPTAQLLLEHGADVNIQDYDLWTPLHVAAACGHTSIAETLLEV